MLGLRTIVLLTTLFFATRCDNSSSPCTDVEYWNFDYYGTKNQTTKVIIIDICDVCTKVSDYYCVECDNGYVISQDSPYYNYYLRRSRSNSSLLEYVRLRDYGAQCLPEEKKQGKAGSVVAVGLVLLTSMFLSF